MKPELTSEELFDLGSLVDSEILKMNQFRKENRKAPASVHAAISREIQRLGSIRDRLHELEKVARGNA